jgi:hypothetical protein
LTEEGFCTLLFAYTKAAIKQDEWDRVAPVGMTKRQAAKEQRLHDATEKAYNELWAYVKGTKE